MKKLSTIVVLFTALCLLLSACGGGAGTTTTAATTTAAPSADGSTAAATTTAAPAADATTAAATTSAAVTSLATIPPSTTTSIAAATGEVDENGVYPEGFPIVPEKLTFTEMSIKQPIQGEYSTLTFWKQMEEWTNIAFEFNTPSGDVYTERKNLAFNTGEYPEVFLGGNLTPQEEVRYGSNEGILIPLEDLIEQYAPNLQRMLETYPDVLQSITMPDGHIYGLPQVSRGVQWTPSFWFNQKWLDALGVTEADLPTTTDQLYDLLIRFRDEDPNGNGQQDELPISFARPTQTGSMLRDMFLPAFGMLQTSTHIYNMNLEDDVIRFTYLEPNYPEFLKFANKLWEEKLIDPDSYVQESPAMNAKTMNNLVGLASQAIPQNLYACPTPEEALTYKVLPPMSSPVNPERMTTRGLGMTRGVAAITDKCANPAAIMRWIDFLYSEEGSLFIHYGPEGDLWEYSPEKPGMMRYILPTDGRTIEEYRGGSVTPDCGTAFPKWVRDPTERNWDDVFQDYRVNYCMDVVCSPFSKLTLPSLNLTPEEQDELDTLTTDIMAFCASSEAAFITGEEDIDAGYPAFVETLKSMGVDDVVRLYQAAFDRWSAAGQ